MPKDQTNFWDGIRVAVDLIRAGASADDLARLLEDDPGQTNPQPYQDRLSDLRKTLGLGFGDVPEEVSQ